MNTDASTTSTASTAMSIYDIFEAQLNEVRENYVIEEYFTVSSRNLKEFILFYMEVDKLMEHKRPLETNEVLTKLNTMEHNMKTLHSTLTNTNQMVLSKLNSHQDTFQLHVQNIINKIQHISDYEIRKSLSEFKTKDNSQQELQVLLNTFYEKVQLANTKTMNDLDKNIIHSISNSIFNLNQTINQNMNNNVQMNKIEDTLTQLHNNFTNNSSKKGEYAENILYNNLCAEFSSSEVIETRNMAHSGDFMIKRENCPTILIESKNFSTNVIKRDIDKFYNDIQQNDCSGIMLNAFGGICNKENYEIELHGKNVVIFIHNYQFDITHVRLAANIIYNITHIIEEKTTDKVEINQKTFNALKIEYNSFMQTFRHHLDNIKMSVNSLQQLQFTLLDEFFKRKKVVNTVEVFKCNICEKNYTTKRSLDRHYQTIHVIKKEKKKNADEVTELSDETGAGAIEEIGEECI